MWKVPDGFKVKVGKKWEIRTYISFPVDVESSERKVYPKSIFSDGRALELGFKPVRKQGYDSENYIASPTVTETDTEDIRDWKDIIPKMSVEDRKVIFMKEFKKTTLSSICIATEMVRDLTYLNSEDPEITEWSKYKSDLKEGYAEIEEEIGEFSDYDKLIVYIKCGVPEGEEIVPDTLYGWSKHIPIRPGTIEL